MMEDGWYIKCGDERRGPITGEQLRTLAAKGKLKPAHRIARQGMTKWVEAGTIRGLFPESSTPSTPAATSTPSARTQTSIPPPPPLPPPPPVPAAAATIIDAELIEERPAMRAWVGGPAVQPVGAKPEKPVISQPVQPGDTLPFPWMYAALVGGVLAVGCLGLVVLGGVWLLSRGGRQDVQLDSADNISLVMTDSGFSFGGPADNISGVATIEPALGEPTLGEPTLPTSSDSGTGSTEPPDLQPLIDALQQQQQTQATSDSSLPPEIAAVVAKADGGDIESMCEMGHRYYQGDGVAVDYALAVHWYQKAVDAGHVESLNDLAYMYVKGLGVAEDAEKAAGLFYQAAQSGSGMGMYNFAVCLGKGIGVQQNDFQSRLWVQKSAEAGYEPAQKTIAEMQAQLKAQIFGAIVGGLLSGGDDGGSRDDHDYFTERRRDREYWQDRARRAESAGDHMDADYSRRQVP